jgi:hypothetical protein
MIVHVGLEIGDSDMNGMRKVVAEANLAFPRRRRLAEQ